MIRNDLKLKGSNISISGFDKPFLSHRVNVSLVGSVIFLFDFGSNGVNDWWNKIYVVCYLKHAVTYNEEIGIKKLILLTYDQV